MQLPTQAILDLLLQLHHRLHTPPLLVAMHILTASTMLVLKVMICQDWPQILLAGFNKLNHNSLVMEYVIMVHSISHSILPQTLHLLKTAWMASKIISRNIPFLLVLSYSSHSLSHSLQCLSHVQFAAKN